MASYDDLGKVCRSAYVLEAGEYAIYIGTNVRDAAKIDFTYVVKEDTVTEQLSRKAAPYHLQKRMLADGSYEELPQREYVEEEGLPRQDKYAIGLPCPDTRGQKGIDFLDFLDSKGVRFSDVADGKMTLDEFMDILTLDDCINLLGGQPNTGCANTFGMGNLPEYGVPNVMTADGPAGLRILPKCGVNTTAWPCATLLASTWDEELVEKVGKAGAEEVKENNISIWLTPACNIHRSPLCGRNFEYYSEDPYLAGKTGAAMVRGIQSQHIGASVKHFAANNKETNRKDSDSRVSERALREIYLKQFEIIVKEAHPYTIMSSYNLINGIHASENKELLTGILRDEWGFDGMVTTDWWTFGEHYRETKAGNDIKMAAGYPVVYAKGYDTKEDQVDEELVAEAVRAAKEAEVAVIFAGLPDAFESEGYDRQHMRLPECQNYLIREICKVNENVVVVLHNGSPVEMPWADQVKGILEVYLGGQAVGGATVDVLYGKVNPSGHLAETFPLKLQDNPSYLYYVGEGNKVEYREGVFVGYRYYDTKEMDVLFPFGHGLSYTTFAYSNMKLDKTEMNDTETLTVQVDVTNTGDRFGKEVVQLYVMPPKGNMIRPVKELKGFEKIGLHPGETKTVTFTLGKRAFAYYDTDLHAWNVESGSYRIALGQSSRNILANQEVQVHSTTQKRPELTMDTMFGDIMTIPGAKEVMAEAMGAISVFDGMQGDSLGEGTGDMMEAMMRYMPLRGLTAFGGGKLTFAEVEKLLEKLRRLYEANEFREKESEFYGTEKGC